MHIYLSEELTNNAANKKIMFKNCLPFTNSISRITNVE